MNFARLTSTPLSRAGGEAPSLDAAAVRGSDAWLAPTSPPRATSVEPAAPARPLAVGAAVMCRFQEEHDFYAGVVQKAGAGGTYDVLFDDGNCESDLARRRLHVAGQVQRAFRVGDGVCAAFADGKVYAAAVVALTPLRVLFDDPAKGARDTSRDLVYGAFVDAADAPGPPDPFERTHAAPPKSTLAAMPKPALAAPLKSEPPVDAPPAEDARSGGDDGYDDEFDDEFDADDDDVAATAARQAAEADTDAAARRAADAETAAALVLEGEARAAASWRAEEAAPATAGDDAAAAAAAVRSEEDACAGQAESAPTDFAVESESAPRALDDATPTPLRASASSKDDYDADDDFNIE
ncbi:hypothetical protein M885DRAFT_540539 [Pelagophyceae sp. CCMP2097]|nr:hypothetical protein M885DRAFT_540539 [Pelagophyceae sp. CCMP2097]